MGKSTFVLTEDLHIQDPHDVFLSLFNASNDEMMLVGSMKDFIKRGIILILAVVGLRALFENYLPGIVDVVSAILIAIASVFFVTYFVKTLIPLVLSIRISLILKLGSVVGVLFIIGVLFGLG